MADFEKRHLNQELLSSLLEFRSKSLDSGIYRLDIVADHELLRMAESAIVEYREKSEYDVINTVDSEEWCHVNFYYKDPEDISTVFLIDKNSASYQRMKESIQIAHSVGRNIFQINLDEIFSDSPVAVGMKEDTECVSSYGKVIQETKLLTDMIM